MTLKIIDVYPGDIYQLDIHLVTADGKEEIHSVSVTAEERYFILNKDDRTDI